MTTSLTIPIKVRRSGQDFTALKTEVSDNIQALSGTNWTIIMPDQGINFIDTSLYALTDLLSLDFR